MVILLITRLSETASIGLASIQLPVMVMLSFNIATGFGRLVGLNEARCEVSSEYHWLRYCM